MTKVIILGGGIAGMSAAHELVERGFDVEVYELKDIPGGKARSINVPNSARPGKKPLPGEHGFRFFPGFYRHVTDTMKRIPYKTNRQGVFDNLVNATRLVLARHKAGKDPIVIAARFPRNLADIELILKVLLRVPDLELKPGELEFFAQRIWQLLTSCKERRLDEYEKLNWWDYLDAERKSPAYQALLARGITTSLVASRAELASVKTIGYIFLQLLLDLIDPTKNSPDHILNGPTNDVWINPWLDYLRSRGVTFHLSTRLRSIEAKPDARGQMQITGAIVTDLKSQRDRTVTGDYYICALPVDMMAGLVSDDLIAGDPSLANLKRLGTSTAWMNGIQFYLNRDIPVTHGHVLYVDAPWALTSISQPSFWPEFPMSDFGDGTVKGIMSAIPSNWGYFIDPNTDEVGALNGSRGLKINKPAQICSPEEIKTEVWEQMQRSLRKNGKSLLKDSDLKSWFLDPGITHNCSDLANNPDQLAKILDRDLPDYFKTLFLWINERDDATLEEIAHYLNVDQSQARLAVNALIAKGFVGQIPLPDNDSGDRICHNPGQERLCYHSRLGDPQANINGEPLLVNLVNTWSLRPDAHTQIPNLFLASDYVRTNTDLATMEAANEAARRAVNSLLDAAGSKAPYCQIWDLQEPTILFLHRWADKIRYRKGLPWNGQLSYWYLHLFMPLVLVWASIEHMLRWLNKLRSPH